KSQAILARKKSGKTAIVQRIFNQLWSQNGLIIPFYYEIKDKKIFIVDFALDYYQRFASQYVSFLERDPRLATSPLSLAELREYGETHHIQEIIRDVDELQLWKQDGSYDLMWEKAASAPPSVRHSLQPTYRGDCG
ncbi:MAG: hypothetical protein GY757_53905, partial [bacterium]|nr:hypothetical protein [bacterium]